MANKVEPNEIGWMFVPQFYTFLHKEPGRLHCFYTKKSTFIHGTEGEECPPRYGQQEIHDRIMSLGFQDCKVYVSNVDSQSSAEGGIIVQVLGEMSNKGGKWRKFAQTFFLAEQPSGYYVLNDIFRYLKDTDEEEVHSDNELDRDVSTPVDIGTPISPLPSHSHPTEFGIMNDPSYQDMYSHSMPPPPQQLHPAFHQTPPNGIHHPPPSDIRAPSVSNSNLNGFHHSSNTMTDSMHSERSMSPPTAAYRHSQPQVSVPNLESSTSSLLLEDPPAEVVPESQSEEQQADKQEVEEPQSVQAQTIDAPSPIQEEQVTNKPAKESELSAVTASQIQTETPSLESTPANVNKTKPSREQTPPSKAASQKAPKSWANMAASASSNPPKPAPATSAPSLAAQLGAANQSPAGQASSSASTSSQSGAITPANASSSRNAQLEKDAQQISYMSQKYPGFSLEKYNQSNCYIRNVPAGVDRNLMKQEIAKRYGTLREIEFAADKNCAYLEFHSVESAKKAILGGFPVPLGGEGGFTVGSGKNALLVIIEPKRSKMERMADFKTPYRSSEHYSSSSQNKNRQPISTSNSNKSSGNANSAEDFQPVSSSGSHKKNSSSQVFNSSNQNSAQNSPASAGNTSLSKQNKRTPSTSNPTHQAKASR